MTDQVVPDKQRPSLPPDVVEGVVTSLSSSEVHSCSSLQDAHWDRGFDMRYEHNKFHLSLCDDRACTLPLRVRLA